MPLYDYACEKCHIGVEEQRKIAERDKNPPICPTCQSPMVLAPSMPQGKFPGADSWRGR